MGNPPQAYILDRFNVTAKELEFVGKLTLGQARDTVTFFKHVLAAGIVQKRRRGWVPVPYTLIKRKLPNASWSALVKDGLIEVRLGSRPTHKCNEYRISPSILCEFNTLTYSALKNAGGVRFNLFDGGKVTSRSKREMAYTDTRKPEPSFLVEAAECVKTGIYNHASAMQYLESLIAQQQSDPSNESLIYRLSSGLVAYNYAVAQGVETDQPGVFHFGLDWKIRGTGRIFGGLQNCSRELKAALYDGIKDCRNFDLRQSQLRLFQRQLALLPSEPSGKVWLDQYLGDAGIRERIAANVGISEETLKGCLYAVLFGAYPKGPTTSIRDHLEDDGVSPERLEETQGVLWEALEPFWHLVRNWYSRLLSDCRKGQHRTHSYTVSVFPARPRRITVTNACGKKLTLQDIEPKKRGRKLAVHVLQGLESCLTHYLAVLLNRRGIQIVSNEHDGLVVIGEIPPPLFDEACRDAIAYATKVNGKGPIPASEGQNPLLGMEIVEKPINPARASKKEPGHGAQPLVCLQSAPVTKPPAHLKEFISKTLHIAQPWPSHTQRSKTGQKRLAVDLILGSIQRKNERRAPQQHRTSPIPRKALNGGASVRKNKEENKWFKTNQT